MKDKQNRKRKKKTELKEKSSQCREGYVPGSIASFLGSGKPVKSSTTGSEGSGLSSFFQPSVVKQTTVASPNLTASSTSKGTPGAGGSANSKKNASTKASGKTNITRKSTLSSQKVQSAFKRKRESIDEEDYEQAITKKKHTSDSQMTHDPVVLSRTVFVGNLPLNITKKELKGLFKIYGPIESIRFRSMGVADPSVSKKVAAIKQELNPKKTSFNAYVVFKENQCAQAALKSNGNLINKHHIRVDIAGDDKKHDLKRSVFVGNLPFSLEDEELRCHFEEFGTVEGVRLIRDKATGVGKGFGYVLFEDSASVQYALKTDGSTLKGRKLRVRRAVKKEKQKEMRGHSAAKGRPALRKPRRGKAPGFQGAKGASRPQSKGKKKQRKHAR